jgi:hypothetical protein
MVDVDSVRRFGSLLFSDLVVGCGLCNLQLDAQTVKVQTRFSLRNIEFEELNDENGIW